MLGDDVLDLKYLTLCLTIHNSLLYDGKFSMHELSSSTHVHRKKQYYYYYQEQALGNPLADNVANYISANPTWQPLFDSRSLELAYQYMKQL